MIGKRKKTVSLAHKEKLLADIAYYEKRIEEALRKTKHNSFEDVESSDDEPNPYTLNAGPSGYELKQQEASLSNCASMTLELAMLTVMQSEVNIMVSPPDVRRPVHEEGTWLEVAAECKIDLVPFTITFYAHKPRRKFAPMRFRSVLVTLTKAAHHTELAGSVLAKQHRPNLALQVLQSYATAFRSRRSTLLELAEKYADKLRMEAMPEGGYRVKFLDLLTVEWTLDNMWSPIVPFCHRMKFEVEYMPKDYIHTIGKLYKQFKDPSLETSERTEVLAQIFDTCLEAQGPARDLQESMESDPETAGRLHERRTTIDQEPEIPPSHLVSPKKLSGKENKAQDRKTNMAPPKTIPKKAKKVANVRKRPNDEVTSDDKDVSKKSKPNDIEVSKHNDVSESKINEKKNIDDRKSVKRGADSDANSNAKKVRTDDEDGSSKSKSGDRTAKNAIADSNEKNNVEKVASSRVNKEVSRKNGDSTKKPKNKGTDETDGKNNDCHKDDSANSKVSLPNKDVEIHEEVGSKTVRGSSNLKKTKKVNTKNDADSKNKGTSKTGVKKTDSKATDAPKDKAPRSSEPNNAESVAGTKAVGDSEGLKSLKIKGVAKNIDDKHAETKSKSTKENLVNSKNSKQVKEVVNTGYNKNIKDKIEIDATSKHINKNSVQGKIKKKDIEKVPSKNSANKTTKKAKNLTEVSEVVDKVEDIGKKAVQLKNNTTEAAVLVKKSDQDKIQNKDLMRSVQKESKAAQSKNETGKVKQIKLPSKEKINDQIKESDGAVNKKNIFFKPDQKTHENYKVLKKKSSNTKAEDNLRKNDNGNEISKANTEEKSNFNNDKNKKSTATIVERNKTFTKVRDVQDNNVKINNKDLMQKKNNLNETFEVAKTKVNLTKASSNQNNVKAVAKLTNADPKPLQKKTVNTKSQPITRPCQKFSENQAKIAEIVKTKIPIMKNKKISVADKLGGKNVGITKAVEKTKIPMKSLPVFKKIVKNLPTRISPRKLPSTFKPSSQGFSNK